MVQKGQFGRTKSTVCPVHFVPQAEGFPVRPLSSRPGGVPAISHPTRVIDTLGIPSHDPCLHVTPKVATDWRSTKAGDPSDLPFLCAHGRELYVL